MSDIATEDFTAGLPHPDLSEHLALSLRLLIPISMKRSRKIIENYLKSGRFPSLGEKAGQSKLIRATIKQIRREHEQASPERIARIARISETEGQRQKRFAQNTQRPIDDSFYDDDED